MAEQQQQVTQQTQVEAPKLVPGSPEYDAAMVAKFENTGVTPHQAADAPKKPEGVPDKFWNAEKGEVDHAAWAKSTTELEAALTKSKQTPSTQTQQPATPDPVKVHADKTAELRKSYTELKAKTDAKPEDVAAAAAALADHLSTEPAKPVQNDDAASKVVADAGLKMEELHTEYAEKGELSADSYAKLEKAGISKAIVDQYIEGQVAKAELIRTQAFNLVGGEDSYVKMAEWAKANMSKAELLAYNAGVDGTPEARTLAVQGLHQRYTTAMGSDPSLLGGNGGGSTTSGFRSRAEMVAAMRDPRYYKDEAYRADVERKVANATF